MPAWGESPGRDDVVADGGAVSVWGESPGRDDVVAGGVSVSVWGELFGRGDVVADGVAVDVAKDHKARAVADVVSIADGGVDDGVGY